MKEMPFSPRHARLHALASHHLVHRHVLAHVAQEVQQAQFPCPGKVVYQRPGTFRAEEARDLAFDGGHIYRQGVPIEQIALRGATPRIAHHSRGAPRQGQRSVTGVLETAQGQQADQVAVMQARGGGVTAVVEGDRALLHERVERRAVGGVLHQTTTIQVSEYVHHSPSSPPEGLPVQPNRSASVRGRGQCVKMIPAQPRIRSSFRSFAVLALPADACRYQGRETLTKTPQKIESSTIYRPAQALRYTFHAIRRRPCIGVPAGSHRDP